MADHAKYSPSAMARIIRCPASVRESSYVPVEPSSPYAEHGSMLHDRVEQYLKGYRNVEVLKDLEPEDREYVLTCIDFIDETHMGEVDDPLLELELRVYLNDWGFNDIFGTVDWAYEDFDNDTLHITDWKFGQGVQVFAQDNEQLMTYAAGYSGYPVTWGNIQIHIVQPPLNHIDTFKFTGKYLCDFMFDVFIPAIADAKSADPTFNPGLKQCRFCPAAMKCRYRYKHVMDAARNVFEAFSEIPNVSNEELGKVLDDAIEYENYVKQVRLYVHRELLAGHDVSGYKLVSGRSKRGWRDEAVALKFLENYDPITEIFKQKMLSPNQAEQLDRKLKKDKAFQKLILKPPGKSQLVGEFDKRKALEPIKGAKQAFAGIVEEGEL